MTRADISEVPTSTPLSEMTQSTTGMRAASSEGNSSTRGSGTLTLALIDWNKIEAIRHCVGACRMVREVGPWCAENALACHEAHGRGRNQPNDKERDRCNNAWGSILAERAGDCATLCDERLNAGDLVTVIPDLPCTRF